MYFLDLLVWYWLKSLLPCLDQAKKIHKMFRSSGYSYIVTLI